MIILFILIHAVAVDAIIHRPELPEYIGALFNVKVQLPPKEDGQMNGQLRLKANSYDFSLLCGEGMPLLMEDHRPRPCQPRPWLKEHRCPTGFWCHEGETSESFYCCPNSRKFSNRCHLPPTVGYGKQLMRRFYYDWKTDGCHELQYTGIGGNENSFMTYEKCEAACRGSGEPNSYPTIVKVKPFEKENKSNQKGSLAPSSMKVPNRSSEKPPDSQRSSSTPASILFTKTSTTSSSTTSKKSEGASPAFTRPTLAPSTSTRIPITSTTSAQEVFDTNPCGLPPDKGASGGVARKMWYFDMSALSCIEFTYLGSKGNGNRFADSTQCMSVCGIGKPTRKACDLPSSVGSGPFKIPRYFFDSVTRRCERFYYSGSDGNDNRFFKKHKCERLCLGKKTKKKEHTEGPKQPDSNSPRTTSRTIQNLVPDTQPTKGPVYPHNSFNELRQSTVVLPTESLTTEGITEKPHPTLVYVPKEFTVERIPSTSVPYQPQQAVQPIPPSTPFNPPGGSPPFNPPGASPPFNPNGASSPFNPPGASPPFNPNGASPPFNPNGASSPFNPPGIKQQPEGDQLFSQLMVGQPQQILPKYQLIPEHTLAPPTNQQNQYIPQQIYPPPQGQPSGYVNQGYGNQPNQGGQPSNYVDYNNQGYANQVGQTSPTRPPEMFSYQTIATIPPPIETTTVNYPETSSAFVFNSSFVPQPVQTFSPPPNVIYINNAGGQFPTQTQGYLQPNVQQQGQQGQGGQGYYQNQNPPGYLPTSQNQQNNNNMNNNNPQVSPQEAIAQLPKLNLEQLQQQLQLHLQLNQQQQQILQSLQSTTSQPTFAPPSPSTYTYAPPTYPPTEALSTYPPPTFAPPPPPTEAPPPRTFTFQSVFVPQANNNTSYQSMQVGPIPPPGNQPNNQPINMLPYPGTGQLEMKPYAFQSIPSTETPVQVTSSFYVPPPSNTPLVLTQSPSTDGTTTQPPAPYYVTQPVSLTIDQNPIAASKNFSMSLHSACRVPLYGDPSILCADGIRPCPTNTFCQIGEGQSICCPLLGGSSCDQPLEEGVGPSSLGRWYFDPANKQCNTFVFKGFQGNQNNFISFAECRNKCDAMNICGGNLPSLPTNPSQRCTPTLPDSCPTGFSCIFIEGGPSTICCPSVLSPVSQSAPSVSVSTNSLCTQLSDQGFGWENLHRWAYEEKHGFCVSFIYKGQGGNHNNFLTKNDCENACKPASAFTMDSRCGDPVQSGHGQQFISRYFYSKEYHQCLHFIYSGEGGNGNNFPNQHECITNCMDGLKFSSLSKLPPTITFSFFPTNICPQGDVLSGPDGQPQSCNAVKSCPPEHVCTPVEGGAFCCPAPESFCLQNRPALSVCGDNGVPIQEIRFTYDPLADRCVRFSYKGCNTINPNALNQFMSNNQCSQLCCNQGYNLVYRRRMLMMLNDDPIEDFRSKRNSSDTDED